MFGHLFRKFILKPAPCSDEVFFEVMIYLVRDCDDACAFIPKIYCQPPAIFVCRYFEVMIYLVRGCDDACAFIPKIYLESRSVFVC
jgi:hypothetical protein